MSNRQLGFGIANHRLSEVNRNRSRHSLTRNHGFTPSASLLLFLLGFCLLLQLSPDAVAQDPQIDENLTINSEQDIYDPLETVNRGVFWFNDKFDVYLLEPVAKGYDSVMPTPARKGVANFLANLKFPIYFVSSLVQLKFGQSLEHTGRFLLNTTLGVAGIFDVADQLGLPHHHEDFGTALGYNGVPSGPYLVLPFLGPSNLRDAVGRGVDLFLTPTFHLAAIDGISDDTAEITAASLVALEAVETRASLLETVSSAKDASLDYYLFTQAAYYQIRRNQIHDIGQDDNQESASDNSEFEIDDEPFEDSE